MRISNPKMIQIKNLFYISRTLPPGVYINTQLKHFKSTTMTSFFEAFL